MRLSKYFFKTIKEMPSDADLKSHKLLIRGGYIKQVSAGIFSYLPLALRALHKIERIIREEMDKIDGYEVNLPVVMPASLWNETGRYQDVGEEMLRFTDRTGRKMLLGMTHEEAVTDMARYVINSYKQLPVMLYQLQTKFRDEPRVRGGLIRVREFIMKDAYSFHTDYEDLDRYYKRAYDAYHKIFSRCGLNVISVSSDVGMMGGTGADEFMAVAESGEDTLILCEKCGYKANREVAKAKRNYKKEEMLKSEEVHTPGLKSIEEVSKFLKISPESTMKAVVYNIGKEAVMCVIRGDLEINETKLRNYLKIKVLQFSEEEELNKYGIVPGFASPINLKKMRLIVDESAADSSNLLSGANKKDYHVKNINFGRDFTSKEVVDISSVKEGEKCIKCGEKLKITRGIEVGNIFKLGTKYSSTMKARYLDETGKESDIIMGCYGIGVGRLLASILEVSSEDNKISWPISVAPFEIELIALATEKDENVKNTAESIYEMFITNDFSILYDDRKASPGFKFNDADLIGSPLRITIGTKSLNEGGAEVMVNNEKPIIIKTSELMNFIKQKRDELFSQLK
ncbi:MAG: proline--tRNA ligase [Spirochaetes bacterium]|nr:proline--tRNA ligase [Spirochaetota bacterium]